MAYTLTIHSISPTSAANTGKIGLVVNFTLSGSGFSLPGFSLSLYDALTGGSYVKSLYYDDINDLQSGMAYSVSFSGLAQERIMLKCSLKPQDQQEDQSQLQVQLAQLNLLH